MTADVKSRLSQPFSAEEVRFKPQTVSGNRALAVAFVDARAIMDRLDAVLGPENWQDDYTRLDTGEVVCRLSLRLNGEWLTKVDVGGQSEQKDAGDRVKSAFSEALKRAAVKWGVGRYLYRLPMTWCDYDPQRKQFTRPPRLPAYALPGGGEAAPKPAPSPAESAARRDGYEGGACPHCHRRTLVRSGELLACDSCDWRGGASADPAPETSPPPAVAPPKAAKRPLPEWALDLTKALNENGVPVADLLERYQIRRLGELPPEHHRDALQWARSRVPDAATFDRWLGQRAASLQAQGKASPEELTEHVLACARRAGETRDPLAWPVDSLRLAIQSVNQFAAQCYAPPVAAPEPQPAN